MTELDHGQLVTRIVESLGDNLFPGVGRFWERVDGDLRPQSVKVIEGRIRTRLTEHAVRLNRREANEVDPTLRRVASDSWSNVN